MQLCPPESLRLEQRELCAQELEELSYQDSYSQDPWIASASGTNSSVGRFDIFKLLLELSDAFDL